MISSLDEAPETLAYDVAVVGAGPAGITLALELERHNLSVGVFEGGPRQFDPTSQARYQGELTTSDVLDYPPLDVLRLRHFGGTSNHWNGWCRPLEENVFTPRAWMGDSSWPFEIGALDAAYRRAHEICELGRPEYDPKTLCSSAGIPIPLEPTETLSTPVWRYSPPTRFAERYSPELTSGSADVWLGANCVGFETTGKRIRSARLVTGSGDERTVRAETFVLACGGIDTLRLLLMLDSSSDLDINQSGRLGVGFQEHPHADAALVLTASSLVEGASPRLGSMYDFGDDSGVRFRIGLGLSEKVLEREGMANVSFTLTKRRASRAVDEVPHGRAVAALESERTGDAVAPLTLRARTEQRENAESRVRLVNAKDDLGMPRVRLDWRIAATDVEDLIRGVDLVGPELQRQGFGPVFRAPRGPEAGSIGGGGHHLGGARMARDPAAGVVDADGRCHGAANLYVSSGATFPSSCFSNPTLTIVALAVRLAEHIGRTG